VVPLLFLAGATVLEISTLWTKPRQSIAGIFLILIGLPFYFFWKSRISGVSRAPDLVPTKDGSGT
jgi:hypothetical protein